MIDDSSLMQLNADLGFEGMKEEIANLEKCGAGKVIGQSEVDALKKKKPSMRVIPSRWVSAYKSETRVRVRIVAKDINKGVSARKLGISSPTPSIEGKTAHSEKQVEKAIGKAVPLKETGVILPAEHGGALTFIGRRIQRGATDDSLSIGVDPKFLDTTFVEFSVNKGSNTVPDVAAVLERALTDKSMQQPLTAAAYSRFRRALGKLLWMAQSRHDLKWFLSLSGSQQAGPTLFFPSNARWLSPGRLTNRKYNCILQIQRIRSVATSLLSTVCKIHNPLCCHRAKTGKQTAKTKTKQSAQEQTTNKTTKNKTARLVVS